MSKAIFITDMPINCYECGIHNYHECAITTTNIEDYMDGDNRPYNCPFKELPKEDNESYFPDEYLDGYTNGWNACINEILGKVENNIAKSYKERLYRS